MSIYCDNCGKELKDTAIFCSGCGAKVEKKETAEPANEEHTKILNEEPAIKENVEKEAASKEPEAQEQQQQGYQYQQANQQQQQYQYQQQQSQNQYQGYHYQQGNQYQQTAYNVPDWDHTAEFDAKDISSNKVVAMLAYLMGAVGIIIALLGSSTSPYAAFHVRQALKFLVVQTLTLIISAFLCWTIIVPIAAGLFMIVLFVVKIICFFSICSGNAKEPPIIRSFKFLR